MFSTLTRILFGDGSFWSQIEQYGINFLTCISVKFHRIWQFVSHVVFEADIYFEFTLKKFSKLDKYILSNSWSGRLSFVAELDEILLDLGI